MTQTFEVAPVAPQPIAAEARRWATLSHLSAFVMFLGIPALVGPLVVWLVKRDDPYFEYHAKEALNFNISFFIYGVVAGVLIPALVGLVLLPIVLVTWFVLAIRASIKASAGEYYRYPMTLRLVK